MEYKDYINLGFERIEMNDNVEFQQTGYHGFCLKKVINENMTVEVSCGRLDRPKLYISKKDWDSCHIIELTGQMVKDIFKK